MSDRDTLIMMYCYAKTYVDARISEIENDDEMKAEYKAELEQMQSFYSKFFDVFHKGDLEV